MIYALAAACLYGLKSIFVKFCFIEGVSLAQLLLIRFAVAIPLFWLVLLLKNKRFGPKLSIPSTAKLATCGIVFSISVITDIVALTYIPAGIERMTLFTFPVIVMLLNWGVNNERPSAAELRTAVLIYGGVVLLVLSNASTDTRAVNIIGVGWALLSAVSFALYMFMSRPLIQELGSLRFATHLTTISGSIIITFYLRPALNTGMTVSPMATGYLGALIVLSTILPAILLSEGLKRIGTNRCSIVSTTGVAVTVLSSCLLLGERFSVFQGIGIAIILLGVISLQNGLVSWLKPGKLQANLKHTAMSFRHRRLKASV